MGKIFGISDLPVSTIETALKGTKVEPLKVYGKVSKKKQMADCFVNNSIRKGTKTPLLNRIRNKVEKFIRKAEE